jgi:phage terminase large subunit
MSITVSRADVITEYVIDDLPNRFIKLPINRYLEEIKGFYGFEEALPSQNAIINAVNKYRFVVAAISRRQGKTFIANIIGQIVALVPGSNILIMSPNYSLSQISFDLQRQLLKYTDIKPVIDNKKDKVIELENGSTIRMGSVNQVDSVVGRSYDLIIFDEAALADGEDAFQVSLRPTLDRNNARAIFISTPRGKTNWFARYWERGFDPEYPEWCSIKATYQDNPRMTFEDIAEAKRSMTEAHFRQEYEADFNTYEGQIWALERKHILGMEECPITEVPSRENMDIIGGLDLGYKDATAFVIIGYEFKTERFFILDEYWDSKKVTSKHAAKIQTLIDKWDPDFIFADHSAAQARADLAYDYDIITSAAKKSVLDGIGYVGTLVENDQVYVLPHCTKVLDAFDGYAWDPNDKLLTEKPLHNEASHMADAIRYALYSHVTSIGIG